MKLFEEAKTVGVSEDTSDWPGYLAYFYYVCEDDGKLFWRKGEKIEDVNRASSRGVLIDALVGKYASEWPIFDPENGEPLKEGEIKLLLETCDDNEVQEILLAYYEIQT